MRAAVLRELGGLPAVEDWPEPQAAGGGQTVVQVLAAGLNPIDVSTGSGTFYGGSPDLPYVVGKEGVGRLGEGRAVYFGDSVAPFGAMAQRSLIDAGTAIDLPEGIEPTAALAFGIAGLAAWLALEWRGQLAHGETVLVLGASGVVGQVGIQAARLLGAAHVVAAARSPEGLRRATELGADALVALDGSEDDLAEAFRRATRGGADLVLDPLWGEPAVAALQATRPGGRLVNLGQAAGGTAEIASAAVRGGRRSILGHANFATPPEVRREAFLRMLDHSARGQLRIVVETFDLERVGEAWERQQSSPGRKLVVVPES